MLPWCCGCLWDVSARLLTPALSEERCVEFNLLSLLCLLGIFYLLWRIDSSPLPTKSIDVRA